MSFKEKIKLVFSGVLDFLMPFIRLFLNNAGQILMATALEVIKELATITATGEEKRRIAFIKIQVDLKEKGIALATSTINSAIEAAYQKYKESNG